MTPEGWATGLAVFAVGLAIYFVGRRFVFPPKPKPPTEEDHPEVFHAFERGRVDRDGAPLCRIRGCGARATRPGLAISTYERDKYFGEQNRLHGRPPRYFVKSLTGECEHKYCPHHEDQVRERLESAIADWRARCARVASQVFDYFTEMNRGGVDREIETLGKAVEKEEKTLFSLPALTGDEA